MSNGLYYLKNQDISKVIILWGIALYDGMQKGKEILQELQLSSEGREEFPSIIFSFCGLGKVAHKTDSKTPKSASD